MNGRPQVLSDDVADRLMDWRKRRALTREQVAARCSDLTGDPAFLTAAALSNIETGRRGTDGRRRRLITLDELVVLAAALDVAPAALLFPIGRADRMEIWPGAPVAPWDAYRWFAATNGQMFARRLDRGLSPESSPEIVDYEMHHKMEMDLAADITRAFEARASAEREDTPDRWFLAAAERSTAQRTFRRLDDYRRHLAARGLILPELDPALTGAMAVLATQEREVAGA
jgi:transcriptional regulator with XRE-family HTH domain